MLGIKKLEAIPAAKIRDYSYLPAGSSFDFNSFISGELTEVPITTEICDFSEEWKQDSKGKYSDFSFSSVTRRKIEETEKICGELTGTGNVFKITFVDGREAIIGSKEFRPNFSWYDLHSGITKKEIKITITLQSLHGVLWNAV